MKGENNMKENKKKEELKLKENTKKKENKEQELRERKIRKVVFTCTFLPAIMEIILLIIAYFKGNGAADLFGTALQQKTGMDAVMQRLTLDFSPSHFGLFVIPVFLLCIGYQIYYIILYKKK